jgi:hypothetical protein
MPCLSDKIDDGPMILAALQMVLGKVDQLTST